MDRCSGVAAHLGSLSTLTFRGLFILFHHTAPRFYHQPQNTVLLLVGHVTRRVQSNAKHSFCHADSEEHAGTSQSHMT